jgi:hypothetical protein
VSDAGGAYNGRAFAARATVAGVIAGVDNTPAATLEGVAPTLSYYRGAFTSPAQLAGKTPLGGAPVNAGAYTVLASFPGSSDYSPGQALATFTVTPLRLTASGVPPIAAPLGTPFSRTVATFANADPVGTPASYSALISWGDGGTSLGIITDEGGGRFAVSGSHTYLSAGTKTIAVQIKHKLGDTTSAAAQDVATVSSAVNTFASPDTADRDAAFAGLTPQERFVQALYLDELGRPGSKAELDGWVAVLSAPGGSQAAVAADIEHSFEARDRLVGAWYAAFLGRPAANGEELGWVNALVSGQTEEQVLSQILASPAFFARAQTLVPSGTADERYVEALYQALLGRAGGAPEVAAWVAALPQLGAQGVAQAFLGSAEFRTDLAAAYYEVLLHRPPDSMLAGWVSSGLDAGAMRAGFESSSEFFTNG